MESAGSVGRWCFEHQCVQGVPKYRLEDDMACT